MSTYRPWEPVALLLALVLAPFIMHFTLQNIVLSSLVPLDIPSADSRTSTTVPLAI